MGHPSAWRSGWTKGMGPMLAFSCPPSMYIRRNARRANRRPSAACRRTLPPRACSARSANGRLRQSRDEGRSGHRPQVRFELRRTSERVLLSLHDQHWRRNDGQMRDAQLLELPGRMQRVAEHDDARQSGSSCAPRCVAMRPPIDLPPMTSRCRRKPSVRRLTSMTVLKHCSSTGALSGAPRFACM